MSKPRERIIGASTKYGVVEYIRSDLHDAEIARMTAERDESRAYALTLEREMRDRVTKPMCTMVKPLVWLRNSYSSNSDCGRYRALRCDNGTWVPMGISIPDASTREEFEAAAQEDHEARILAELTCAPIAVQDAAQVLVEALSSGQIGPFDVDDPEIEALARKFAGNRGDGVAQLEIGEAFFKCALRVIAEGKA